MRVNIVRLPIGKVSKLWDSIRYGVIEAFEPKVTADGQMLQEVLGSLLKEEKQCWCIYNDEKRIYGYVITSIEKEVGKRSLLIYSEYAFTRLPSREAYVEVTDKLERFARENGCHRVIGYSMNPNAISLAEKLGYSSDYRVLIKEV